MGKNYSEILHSIKNKENNLTLEQMFDISEKLIPCFSSLCHLYGAKSQRPSARRLNGLFRHNPLCVVPSTLFQRANTILTWCRFIVFELILKCNGCNFTQR